MFIRRGFSENYETVGKDCFTHSSLVKELKKDERASDELMAQNSVIRFNSEYMDVLGNWYFFKTGGVLAFVILIIIALPMLLLMILLVKMPSSESISVTWEIIGYLGVVGYLVMIGLFFHQIRRDFFHYTYYPMRFNRLERKVYVTNPNKKVSVYNWDDLTVTINNTSANHYYVRLSTLGENHNVKQTFALPYISNYGLKPGLINHWEFFRRYMEEEPVDTFNAINEYYNIHDRKEKMAEICYAMIMVDRDTGDNLEDSKLTKTTKHAKRHFWLNDVCTCHGLLPSHSA